MRKWLVIWMVCGICLSVDAVTLTATVETKNSVSLTCDSVPLLSVVSAKYRNTGNKGQVTRGDTAILSICDFPQAEIRAIRLWMRSNEKSGAATVSMAINDTSWIVVDGKFMDWPGLSDYSTTHVPISGLNHTIDVNSNSVLTVAICGDVSSVYLQKMEVDLFPAPKRPYSVTLKWPTSSGGWNEQTLTEDSIGLGVLLPAPLDSVVLMDDTEWHWLGWCEQIQEITTQSPLCWQTGDWYMPNDDVCLYALFTDFSPTHIPQDSSWQSAEYMLVQVVADEVLALSGNWTDGRIPMQPVPFFKDSLNHLYCLMSSIDDDYRYQLTFTKDSLTIRHVGTNAWVGFTAKTTSRQKSSWAWHKAIDGSLFIHSTWELVTLGNLPSYTSGKSLAVNINTEGDGYYVSYSEEAYLDDYAYWRLFPTSAIPQYAVAHYTTFEALSHLPSTINEVSNCARKFMTGNGQMIIQKENKQYNLLGNEL